MGWQKKKKKKKILWASWPNRNVFNGTTVKVDHTCYAPLTTAEKCVQTDLETFRFCVCFVSGSCQRTIVRFNHLGEVRVKVAVGKHFLNFSLQVLMRLLISSSVFAPSEVQEFVAKYVECLAHHAQQHANAKRWRCPLERLKNDKMVI